MTDGCSRRETVSLLGVALATHRITAASQVLERLEEWLSAGRETRHRGIELSLERIWRMDGSIRAWVEVHPQPQTGDGPLAGIPFGVKDVFETKDLTTEYGSP